MDLHYQIKELLRTEIFSSAIIVIIRCPDKDYELVPEDKYFNAKYHNSKVKGMFAKSCFLTDLHPYSVITCDQLI